VARQTLEHSLDRRQSSNAGIRLDGVGNGSNGRREERERSSHRARKHRREEAGGLDDRRRRQVGFARARVQARAHRRADPREAGRAHRRRQDPDRGSEAPHREHPRGPRAHRVEHVHEYSNEATLLPDFANAPDESIRRPSARRSRSTPARSSGPSRRASTAGSRSTTRTDVRPSSSRRSSRRTTSSGGASEASPRPIEVTRWSV